MPDRQVRCTDSFFDRLDSLFADERGADGSPSATDFLLYDIPRIRDRLASDFEGNALPTDDPDVRVYIGSGVLVTTVAVYAVSVRDVVEVIWLSVQEH
jgi:hypothetical protein